MGEFTRSGGVSRARVGVKTPFAGLTRSIEAALRGQNVPDGLVDDILDSAAPDIARDLRKIAIRDAQSVKQRAIHNALDRTKFRMFHYPIAQQSNFSFSAATATQLAAEISRNVPGNREVGDVFFSVEFESHDPLTALMGRVLEGDPSRRSIPPGQAGFTSQRKFTTVYPSRSRYLLIPNRYANVAGLPQSLVEDVEYLDRQGAGRYDRVTDRGPLTEQEDGAYKFAIFRYGHGQLGAFVVPKNRGRRQRGGPRKPVLIYSLKPSVRIRERMWFSRALHEYLMGRGNRNIRKTKDEIRAAVTRRIEEAVQRAV